MKPRLCIAAMAGVLASGLAFSAAFAADKAWTACQSDKPAASIAGCTTVIKRGAEAPADRAIAYYNRGNSYFNTGNIDKAIADYTASIEINSNYPNAFFNRGNAYSNEGDLDKAIADYSEVVRLDPSYAFAFFNRGNAYFKKDQIDLAIDDYDSTITLNPTYAPAYLNRGNTYALKQDYERAIANYDQVLELEPKNELARGGRTRAVAQAAVKPAPKPEVETAAVETQVPKAPAVETETTAKQPAVEAQTATKQPAAGLSEKRIALVIGNAAYSAVPKLPNPPRDAEAVGAALRDSGFSSVTVVNDATRADLVDALNAFADRAASADWAVIYFAGHGIELDGINYLIPVDAKLKSDRDVQDEAVSLDRVVSAVEGAKKLKLVILDACRNNPFVPDMKLTVASRSISRGLARVEPSGGTLVAYAAKGGQEAVDGEGVGNSPFAAALVSRLQTPGLEVGKLFRLVRDDVLAATGQRQEPFVYGSLPGEDFFFRPN
jgi:tetratricopeptide (TPR) repeat protein